VTAAAPDTLRGRLRQPRVWLIAARHAVPLVGVFALEWSALETTAALFLDALSSLWLLGALAAYFTMRRLAHGDEDFLDRVNLVVGGVCLFAVVAALLTFAVAVPAWFAALALFGAPATDWRVLLEHGRLVQAFGVMLALQAPRFFAVLTGPARDPAGLGLDTQVGFLLHRLVTIAIAATALSVLGSAAIDAVVVVAQAYAAGTEIMRDHVERYLRASRRR